MVEVADSRRRSSSRGMAGSRMPIAIAHGEGYAEFRDAAQIAAGAALVALRFVDNRGERDRDLSVQSRTARPQGITGLTTADGRFTIMMPHPERVFRTRADVVASGRLGRGFAVDADVPQRARWVG